MRPPTTGWLVMLWLLYKGAALICSAIGLIKALIVHWHTGLDVRGCHDEDELRGSGRLMFTLSLRLAKQPAGPEHSILGKPLRSCQGLCRAAAQPAAYICQACCWFTPLAPVQSFQTPQPDASFWPYALSHLDIILARRPLVLAGSSQTIRQTLNPGFLRAGLLQTGQ